MPFCFSNTSAVGSNCGDPYVIFDFKFTNEDITGVSVNTALSSTDFPVATFGAHLGLQFVSPNEFTVDVTGADPAYLSTLVIDVKTGGGPPTVPEPSTWAMMLIGFASLGLAGYRRAIRLA
jgi:PEP-CTERM motif